MDGPAEGLGGGYAYPRDLAALVHSRWAEVVHSSAAEGRAKTKPVPSLSTMEALFSICYQASLLYEEGRPVTFRVAFAEPEDFAALAGPPGGLHRLLLTLGRPLDPQELRRLAAAATFHRSLLGVSRVPDGGLQIWGIIHSGTRWLQGSRGGRDIEQLIPSVLTVGVIGPGRLLISKGTTTIAELAGGSVAGRSMDVLYAPWLPTVFTGLHGALSRAHEAARTQTAAPWARLDPSFGVQLARHVLRRVLTRIRGAHHGGMLVLLPAGVAEEAVAPGGTLSLKYRFRDEEPRRRFFELSLQIMNELASRHTPRPGVETVGWIDYETSADPRLIVLDEALFEVAHMIAAFAGADGAVVLTDSLELLGFGGEIAGVHAPLRTVTRALDLEGTDRQLVRTDGVGTRHRSAYRLCEAIPGAVAIAVSQDGGLRFIRQHDGAVTYWDQLANGPWET